MYNCNDTDKSLEEMIKLQKDNLKVGLEKNFQAQEKTLEIFVKGINHSAYNKFNDTRLIWNIAGFINIVSYDLKIIGRDLTFADSEWQKRLYARQACLLIYESINDLFDLLGKDFKSLVSTKITNKTFETELKDIKAELNQFKDKHIELLKKIRHNAIAHRDNDIMNQINLIYNICWSDIIGIVTTFDGILNKLGPIIQRIIYAGLNDFDELKGQKINKP